jgi:phosphatidate cytidylyltransferase
VARSETTTRVLVAAAGIPVALGAIYLGGWVLAALLALVVALAVRELFAMAALKQARGLSLLGTLGAVGLVAAAAGWPDRGTDNPLLFLVLVLLTLAAGTSAIWQRGVEHQPLLSVAVTVFGAAYTGLLAFALFLRHLPGIVSPWHGAALLFAPVLMTWVSDSAAYFGGRAFGRHKLIPKVSPGKTVEGSVSALVVTLVAAIGYSVLLALFPTYRMSLPEAALFGVLMSAGAQVGDLTESLFKRDVGVKDSGKLLPGHGGALDRFDSLFFTLPLAYALLRYVVGA